MLGLMDMGGGMRDIYGAGITDCFLDNGIRFDYCIGVSAGCANIASFLAEQRGRNFKFYTQYALRKEYMGAEHYFKDGSFFNLDYVYSYLSNSGGEDPLDYEKMISNKSEFVVVATEAQSGEPVYFDKTYFKKDDYSVIKASCSVPILNRPYEFLGREYYDGGVSDPLPIEKALSDGCDKVVVVLTRPVGFVKKPEKFQQIMRKNLGDAYPNVMEKLHRRHEIYNDSMNKIFEYQKQGKAVIIAPSNCRGVNMATKDVKRLNYLYECGYSDALSAIDYI